MGIMSQGTSGDQMWMDYGQPRDDPEIDRYADGLAETAYQAYKSIKKYYELCSTYHGRGNADPAGAFRMRRG